MQLLGIIRRIIGTPIHIRNVCVDVIFSRHDDDGKEHVGMAYAFVSIIQSDPLAVMSELKEAISAIKSCVRNECKADVLDSILYISDIDHCAYTVPHLYIDSDSEDDGVYEIKVNTYEDADALTHVIDANVEMHYFVERGDNHDR